MLYITFEIDLTNYSLFFCDDKNVSLWFKHLMLAQ